MGQLPKQEWFHRLGSLLVDSSRIAHQYVHSPEGLLFLPAHLKAMEETREEGVTLGELAFAIEYQNRQVHHWHPVLSQIMF